MEVLETDYIKWPGATHGLRLDAGFQILDRTFLEEDQYDEFLKDPTAFLFNKVYSARHKKLKGLEKAVINNIVEYDHFASLTSFADPEVKDALMYLMRAGDEAVKWLNGMNECAQVALEHQVPLGVMAGHTTGYDAFADMLAGLYQCSDGSLYHAGQSHGSL